MSFEPLLIETVRPLWRLEWLEPTPDDGQFLGTGPIMFTMRVQALLHYRQCMLRAFWQALRCRTARGGLSSRPLRTAPPSTST